MKKVFEAPVVEVCDFSVEVIMVSADVEPDETDKPNVGPDGGPVI